MSAPPSQTPARAQDESLTSVLVALAANTAIAIAKGAAAALTGSPALLAETLHTVADAGNEVFLYVAHSAQPAPGRTPRTRSATARSATSGRCSPRSASSSSAERCRSGTASAPFEPARAGGVLGRGRSCSWSRSSWTGSAASSRCASCASRPRGARSSVRELLRESPDPTVVTVYFEDTVDVLGAAARAGGAGPAPRDRLGRTRRARLDRDRRPALLPGVAAHRAATASCSPTSRCPSATCERMRDRLESRAGDRRRDATGGRLPRAGGGAGRRRRADGRRARRRRRERGAGAAAGRRGARCPGGQPGSYLTPVPRG